MTTTSHASTASPEVQRAGASLAGSAIATVAVFVVSLLSWLAAGGGIPEPYSDDDEVLRFVADHHPAVAVNGLLLFAAAIGLAVFTAALSARMRALAPNAAGPAIATVGGILASSFLALSALTHWAVSRQDAEQRAVVRALQNLFFVLGGPAHVAALGLLVAGVSVTAMALRLVPRWFGIASLVVAALAGLSVLTLLTTAASPLIPLGRFPAFIWLIAVSLLLSRNHPTRAR